MALPSRFELAVFGVMVPRNYNNQYSVEYVYMDSEWPTRQGRTG